MYIGETDSCSILRIYIYHQPSDLLILRHSGSKLLSVWIRWHFMWGGPDMRYNDQNPPQPPKDRYSNQKGTLFRDQDLASVLHILGFPFIFEVTGLRLKAGHHLARWLSVMQGRRNWRQENQAKCKIHLASRPRGGIEPLHVPISLDLKSSPNPSWNHGGLLTQRPLSGTLFNLGRHGCNYLIATLKTKPSSPKSNRSTRSQLQGQVREHARPARMEKTTTKSG